MAPKALPSPEVLRQLLRYEPETGKLFWLERGPEFFPNGTACKRWNSRLAGMEAFGHLIGGYPSGSIFNNSYLAHRVIWALQTGEWPKGDVDHINGHRSDNRWVNLRNVPHQENQMNYPKPKSNTSGVMGVYWSNGCGKWRAAIRVGGKKVALGSFLKFEDAVAAQMNARKLHAYHPNHGRVV